MARGFRMTRIFAATAILFCLAFSISKPAQAQATRNMATDNGCFPWQDFKNGQCVAKPSQAPPPSLPAPTSDPLPAVAPPPPPPPPVVANPCPDGTSNVAGQCVCPTSTHLDGASGRCVADISTRAPQPVIACDGGTVTNGACACPQGFNLMPASGDAEGGTCARTNAENCLGGELTVSGKCMCSGQVTMDGETYLLEYSNGKCLPMRCPVTALRDGKCGTNPSAKASQEPENKERPAPREARETRDAPEESEHGRHCGRGMIHTRSGCVEARRRRDWDENAASARQYYRRLYPGPVTPPF
jgi:hypothetical protein